MQIMSEEEVEEHKEKLDRFWNQLGNTVEGSNAKEHFFEIMKFYYQLKICKHEYEPVSYMLDSSIKKCKWCGKYKK